MAAEYVDRVRRVRAYTDGAAKQLALAEDQLTLAEKAAQGVEVEDYIAPADALADLRHAVNVAKDALAAVDAETEDFENDYTNGEDA